MTSTTAPTGASLDLRHANHREAGVQAFATKTAAVAALARLRASGHNVNPHIEVHRAETFLARFWVIGWPDHFEGVTYLMTATGAWVAGRLTDAAPCFCTGRCAGHPAPWAALGRPQQPATFTHTTRVVPDSYNQHERYKTKSNGSCGRFVRTDESVALCVCGWKGYEDTRDAARRLAARHRDNPEQATTYATAA